MTTDPIFTQAASRLPEGLQLVAVLSADGRALRVSRGEEDLVLRWVDDPAVLRAEWATLARVRHPVVAAPLEWGEAADGRAYVLRAFVPGQTLDRALIDASAESAARWIDDLLAGLDALHGVGLVHRDVKAANVVVDGERAHLLDLEFVHSAEAADGVAGTRLHVAPEVLTGGRHGPRADLFSLGVTLALAYCGTPSTSFGRRFPSTSFWDAARLDPERLPEELAALTRALVMRRPEERPSSAAAAREFLPGGTTRVPPSLQLPPLAGRAELLHGWMQGAGAAFDLLVVGVPDPEELEPAAEALRLAAAFEGRRTAPLRAVREADLRALTRPPAGGRDLVVTQGAPFAPGAVSEVVFSLLEGPPSGGFRTLVLSVELADRVRAAITPGLSESETRRVRWERLPRVELATLTAHLERISEGSSPRAAETLARDLLERTGGRQSDLDLYLANAVAAGVVRPVRGGYALLRVAWPEEHAEARGLRLRELPTSCAELLLAMGCVPGAGADRLAKVAGIEADELGAAIAGLREVGALATGGDAQGRVLLAGGGWVEAAERALATSTRRALVRRARRTLEESGAEMGVLAAIDLRAASTEEELASVLESAESVRSAGRLAEARQLALGVSERADQGSLPTAGRNAATLLARLDIGQSDAAAASARLARLYGEELAEADQDALLVGAEAAELEGRRGPAREFYERVAASPDASLEQRLRALIGLGYGRLLDGDPAGALEVTEGHPSLEDADEPAGTLLNLKLGALAQLGRFDEAQELLALACERASASGDPTLQGRTELNRGFLDRRRGRLVSAAEALRAATEAFGRTDNVKMRALAANNSGVLQRDLGNLVTASALLEQGLRLRRRLADTYGAASSQGSLAVVVLESGKVGRALAELHEAEREMAAGQHEAERAFLDAHRALALALAGSAVEARGMMEGEHWSRAQTAHPLLTARAEALAWLAEGRREEAAEHLSRACDEAPEEADVAEVVRSRSLLCALDPTSHTAREALLSACERVGSDSRLSEAQWRTRERGALPSASDLQRWLEVFEAAGRTDLVRVVSLELAVVHERDGRRALRRAALASAESAAEALVDGLDREQAERSLGLLELVAAGSGREPSAAALSAEWFLACNRAMASCRDLEELLTNIIDMALEVTEGRRGFLVLMREGRALARVARGMESEDLAEEQQRFSSSVVREAITDGAPIVCLDAAVDDRFASMQSVRDLALRSVLCLPLAGEGDFEGAIYVDNDRRDSMFDERDVEAVRALADQASIAIRELRRRTEIEHLNARLQERVDYQAREIEHARERLERSGDKLPIGGMIGESQGIRRVQELVERLAPTNLPVLVTGPSGAGKDLVARALHEHSERASGPFVAENVAVLPESLVESALFGHVRGAFTGAGRDHRGLFEEAHGGTFFLDEIGDLPAAVQAKLLRVLETGEVRPLGGNRVLRVDVRIVAATNRPLASMVEEGTFRRDLFYRLNAGEIAVPSLAERVEDVPLLVEHFLRRLCREHDRPLEMSAAVLAALVGRPWPGEVRELANEVARLFFLADGSIDRPDQVRPPADLGSRDPMPASFELDAVERAAILRALRATDGGRTAAAKLLGISRAGLYTKLRRLEI